MEKYVTQEIIKFYDDKNSPWTEEELIKIIAFAANTTDPTSKILERITRQLAQRNVGKYFKLLLFDIS
ncbi:hypothetical protein HX13_17165 [Chryseobacterium sp. P1-3]|uniref:hypothetical protein n=1 Tax=Chryseobacterium sp. (strain P1-3) TaxID=1517683 RepID=UPI0004E75CAA|nr:hypothetical protein [Chryseobacterium sp. P1-3]KFF73885.1 hypothetical protein HX13_17165 [Chryseobacterium sp. P1-3]